MANNKKIKLSSALHNLSYKPGARGHKRKVSGRGSGSGSIRGFKGNKGQGQRITGRVRAGFEGGQTPIYRRLRKIGFNNYEFANNFNVINLKQLVTTKKIKLIDGTTIDKKLLLPILDNQKWPIKIIDSDVNLPKKLIFCVEKITSGAQKRIEKNDGKIEIISSAKTKEKKVAKQKKNVSVKQRKAK